MMWLRGLLSGGLLFCSFIITGQNFNRNDFFEADMAMMAKDYERAQTYYERILRADPENANINFLHGLCLINITGRKKESLKFFEKAAPKASADYQYGNAKETKAPLEVIKYYAMACLLNDNISKAIELLNQYKAEIGSKEKDEINVANKLIESCERALTMQTNPVFYKAEDLGKYVAKDKPALYPVVNNEENMLLFAMHGVYGKDDIYFSRKKNGTWSKPVKITSYLGIKGEAYPTSISADNERLYLTVNTGNNNDIYYSFFAKGRWQKIIKLSKPINSKSSESNAYESSDGNYLYFSSDRKNGFGNLDIYVSSLDGKGNWGKPVNLGGPINTPDNELMLCLNTMQNKLFFRSDGHTNMGGYDVFISKGLGNNSWGQPENLGYPINTTDDDIHFMPVQNGNFAYVSSVTPDFEHNYPIHYIEIFSPEHPRQFTVSGKISLEDVTDNYENFSIEIYNSDTYELLKTIGNPGISGNYNFEVKSGNYMINYVKENYIPYSQSIQIADNQSENIITLDPFLEKVKPVVEEIPQTLAETEIEEIETEYSPEDSPVEDINAESIPPPALVTEPVYAQPEPAYTPVTTSYTSETNYEGTYTIQFMASVQKIDMDYVEGAYKVEIQKGNDKYYRYITGVYRSPEVAENIRKEIVRTKYKNAFVRYYNLEDYLYKPAIKTNTQYTIQLMALKQEISNTHFKGIHNIKVSYGDDGYYRYTTGEFNTLNAARKEKEKLADIGYKKAYIRKITNVSNYR